MFGHIIDSVRTVDCFLYGRRMYEGMAEYWPTADTDPESDDQHVEFSRKWKDTPKIVFSRSLDHADWNTRVVSADIGAEITRLKRQPGGGLVLFGGADIASSLMKLDLIDEFHLFVHPVVLGGARRCSVSTRGSTCSSSRRAHSSRARPPNGRARAARRRPRWSSCTTSARRHHGLPYSQAS
ncbi:MAG: dihydrofolate reductase family protein [Thermoleophilaceae bacterium]